MSCCPSSDAGTSLGDPIEVGAALAVYSKAPRQQPLILAASKSWVGHAEPAAGLAGLLFAHAAVTQALTLPLLHLNAVNPYVATALDQSASSADGGASALLPKQGGAGPRPADAREAAAAIWGVSAFAFQGSNAHAVLASGSLPAVPVLAAEDTQGPVWQRKRHYVLPPANLLISAASVTAAASGVGGGRTRRAVFHAELAAASLAFMWDHQVMGKAIFPGEHSWAKAGQRQFEGQQAAHS
jgi:acyl transferase domain-containing protein